MLEERYRDLVNSALAQYERLQRVCGDEEVVFVISRDVRRAIQGYYDAYLEAEVENHEIFYGVAIYTIGGAVENMLQAVVCGRNYYEGMRIGDMILYENRLWQLNGNANFIDTELTVPYEALEYAGENRATEYHNSADYAEAIVRMVDMFNDTRTPPTVDIHIDANAAENTVREAIQRLADIPLNNTFSTWPAFTETARRKKMKVREEEFSAGDTELLDKFLDSFTKR